jgi:hypothetical protein
VRERVNGCLGIAASSNILLFEQDGPLAAASLRKRDSSESHFAISTGKCSAPRENIAQALSCQYRHPAAPKRRERKTRRSTNDAAQRWLAVGPHFFVRIVIGWARLHWLPVELAPRIGDFRRLIFVD